MGSITHILSSIDTFSKSIFKFSQFIDVFKLLKSFPDSISFELNNSDFIHHLSKAQYHLDHLTEFFDSTINPLLTKELHKLKISKPADKMIPYADFTIDKIPVFKDIEPQHLSFEDIIKKAIVVYYKY